MTRPVPRRTVERLTRPEARAALLPQPYYFCDARDCDVVYVSALGDHLITKDQLAVRVGIKERVDPIPVCYCFGFDRKAIRDDIRRTGATGIQQMITSRVRAGECRCEDANPSGGCCLGEVSRQIRLAQALNQKGAL
jgi:hypothetical protein